MSVIFDSEGNISGVRRITAGPSDTFGIEISPDGIVSLPTGAIGLGDLTDVDTTGAGTNDVLAFNGTTWVPDDDVVRSTTVTTIVTLTQAAYDALTPDANTLYVITD